MKFRRHEETATLARNNQIIALSRLLAGTLNTWDEFLVGTDAAALDQIDRRQIKSQLAHSSSLVAKLVKEFNRFFLHEASERVFVAIWHEIKASIPYGLRLPILVFEKRFTPVRREVGSGRDQRRPYHATICITLTGLTYVYPEWHFTQDIVLAINEARQVQVQLAGVLEDPSDGHADRTFDYLLANPPYGKDWNLDADEVRKEAARATKNRFVAGLPRISDGQLLFLQHMLGRMHHPGEGVSRVSIIMNGSPLFTGDAGSGESEIRRWILENDYLEALIALPQQLFYNTGISTYVWVLANTKPADRKGKVILIDASEAWLPRRKSLGDKRRDIPDGVDRPENYIPHIVKLFEAFADGTFTIPADDPKELRAKVFPTTAFGYRKVTIERPLRLNFQASPERIARLVDAKAFQNLAVSRLKDPDEKAAAEAAGQRTQQAIRDMLATLPKTLFTDRAAFLPVFETAVKKAGLRLAAPVKRAVLDALSERDETAAICRDEDDQPEADSELRDTENVPLGEDVPAFFDREVKPHVPDAWVNETIRDAKDGGIGIVGYEINFNRYFYRYTPPRPLEAIEADIKAVEADVLKLLKEVAG